VITWGLILRVGWGGGSAGEGAQQRSGSESAGQSAPVSLPTVEAS
jgi:hypothetical protein